MKTIKLDFTKDLPKLRAAYDAKELQAQKEPGTMNGCLYAGPCGIGVMIPEDQRAALDGLNDTDISSHIEAKNISVPAEQRPDFVELQRLHDSVVWSRTNEQDFVDFIDYLEKIIEENKKIIDASEQVSFATMQLILDLSKEYLAAKNDLELLQAKYNELDTDHECLKLKYKDLLWITTNAQQG